MPSNGRVIAPSLQVWLRRMLDESCDRNELPGDRLAAITHLQAAEQACRSELWLNPTCSWSAGKRRILQRRFHSWEAANASPNKVLRSGAKRRSRHGDLAL